MSKRLIVLLAISTVGLAGVSAAAAPRVSLQIRPAAINYGDEVLLKGKIPSTRANQKVVVMARMCRFTGAAAVRTLTTRKGGAFSFRVGPTLRTSYFVSWGKAKSRQVTVRVAPQIQIQALGQKTYNLSIAAGGGASFKDKRAFLQRFRAGKWRVIGNVPLKQTSRPDALTAVWSGDIKPNVKRGWLLRAALPLSQARPCYRAVVSKSIRG